MAFNIKGLHYFNLEVQSPEVHNLIETLADRLVAMYEHESAAGWDWFEGYLTYANAVMPEAMLLAWQSCHNPRYLTTAVNSFSFLLSQTFTDHEIKVISNTAGLAKGEKHRGYGEQPIDVAYSILALHAFYACLGDEAYLVRIKQAFSWFLGNNHLHQILYNPCTGGCYDGLEEFQVNLNQGAESTLSYLMSRLVMEKNNYV
jgi:uncharacterized protein YyaL (SSP411 family)